MSTASDRVIVVGGRLTGMTAANTILENGGRVVLLDKSFLCGGNSTKATRGINGANTRTQNEKGIKDCADLFTSDTLKGGAKEPKLAMIMSENNAAGVQWSMDKFTLDLSLVPRLGGHSAPQRFPVMAITYAFIEVVEIITEKVTTRRSSQKRGRQSSSRPMVRAPDVPVLASPCPACVFDPGGRLPLSMRRQAPCGSPRQ